MVLDGRFRADLYYRLDVVRITLPSLRDHASDIPLIAAAILRRLNTLLGVSRALSPAAVDTLMLHAWPGNVRQLAACLERAAVTCRGDTIEPRDLGLPHLEPVISTQPLLKRSAAEAVRFALAEANGNRAAAARRLGIGRAQLYRMIDRFGIDATPSTNGEA